jgi:hypothetical protein
VAESEIKVEREVKGRVSLVILCCFTAGCASILDGSHQHLSIETRYRDTQVVGAVCIIANDKGSATVITPASLSVNRSSATLSAKCEKEGFAPGSLVLQSATKALAFLYMLVGGIIGTMVDVTTGAVYEYPSSITIEMGSAGDLAQSRSATAVP